MPSTQGFHLTRRQLLRHSALGALAFTALPRHTHAATPMRMACWSQPISEQTNVFAAQEFGWFREAEIEFTFVPGAGGGAAVKNVLAGNAAVGFANTEPLLVAADSGANLE